MSPKPATYPTVDVLATPAGLEVHTFHRGSLITVMPGPLDFDCQIDGEHHGSYLTEEAAILAAVAHIDLLAR